MVTRSWTVELWLDGCGNPEVCVSVDGRALLPHLALASAVDALAYIDEALVDFHRGDHIALIARRSPQLMVAWTTQIRALALHWCADVLQGAWSLQVGLMRADRAAARGLSQQADEASSAMGSPTWATNELGASTPTSRSRRGPTRSAGSSGRW